MSSEKVLTKLVVGRGHKCVGCSFRDDNNNGCSSIHDPVLVAWVDRGDYTRYNGDTFEACDGFVAKPGDVVEIGDEGSKLTEADRIAYKNICLALLRESGYSPLEGKPGAMEIVIEGKITIK